MNRSGVVACPPASPLGEAERDLVLRGVREAAVRGPKSVAIDREDLACVVLPLDGPAEVGAPLLAAVMPRPTPPDLPLLLADATSSLSLCWEVEDARRQHSRLRIADARAREAVLHLLMNGQISAARQVAGALGITLPAVVWVYVIEGPPAERGAAADALAEVAEGAWVVPCPVYADHLMVLADADSEAHADNPPQWAWPASVAETCRIGVSDAVALRDTATGYAQAFHALAAARHRTERQASFAAHADLALTIGPAAAAWAEAFLAPLHAHRARRSQDPDSAELLATAASWLSFSSHATAHLKIHRNTLTARLTLIQELLALDLNRLADQAALALALRALAARNPPRTEHPEHPETERGTAPSMDELLALPHVAAWAQRQFQPVRALDVPTYVDQTLTTWLRLDARIGPTAAALSLSASAVRKRLARSEALLQRSLLRSPSAVHDQWLALRVLDLAEQSPEAPSNDEEVEFTEERQTGRGQGTRM
ncbi:helix-turn-helix domain-containing protein [Actinocrinis puniceicyclus]|uniref:Helix-turn-helix domain-containing protein n=1 Tax=Actinocrinis puniceicyclus TaxID=977794 RepID=A0A8J8BA01_9ACTN|nr:helix-turn-helix domain-containing protein [Actinocrinis puniceicyclus]MBS2962392.1 helix-turn-helix domain-containing protein [Actinocrinis puniceicyclus]